MELISGPGITASFEGKVAVVTGAGGGIGLATAEAFAKAGASVIVADRDEETIGKAAEGLRSAGHNAIGVTCDVTDTAQVEAMVKRAVSTYGRLDAAFNNAGVNPRRRVSGNERRRIRTHHERQPSRRVELHEGRTSADDGARKRGNRQLFIDWRHGGFERAQCLFRKQACGDRPDADRRARLCRQGIRINAVCPGMVNTPMAIVVTKNYDPEIVRRWWRRNQSDASASPKRSPQPWYGCAVRPRASWLVMPWRLTEAFSRACPIQKSNPCDIRNNTNSQVRPQNVGVPMPSSGLLAARSWRVKSSSSRMGMPCSPTAEIVGLCALAASTAPARSACSRKPRRW